MTDNESVFKAICGFEKDNNFLVRLRTLVETIRPEKFDWAKTRARSERRALDANRFPLRCIMENDHTPSLKEDGPNKVYDREKSFGEHEDWYQAYMKALNACG